MKTTPVAVATVAFVQNLLATYAVVRDELSATFEGAGMTTLVYQGGFDIPDGRESEVCFTVWECPLKLRWASVVLFQDGHTVASAILPADKAREVWAKCKPVATDSGRNEMLPRVV